MGYRGPRDPVPRGTELDGNSTADETVLLTEEEDTTVIALEAASRGAEPDGRGLGDGSVLQGVELSETGRDEANMVGKGATEVTLLFVRSYPGPSWRLTC